MTQNSPSAKEKSKSMFFSSYLKDSRINSGVRIYNISSTLICSQDPRVSVHIIYS